MPNYKRLFLQNHYVFLTIVTNNRQPLLIDNIELLRESFKRAKQTYNFEIFASVILPEHIHLILLPKNINEYPKIIFAIKYHFSRNIKNNGKGGLGNPPYCALTKSKLKKKEKGIWQRRFYEHTIRDEKDLYAHLDYVHYNPLKHGYIKNVKDWEFSSFHKFVNKNLYEKEWGSQYNINEFKYLNVVEFD